MVLTKTQRIAGILAAGALAIGFAVHYQKQIHRAISPHLMETDISARVEITKGINRGVEDYLKEPNAIGLSEDFRFNHSAHKQYKGWIGETIKLSKEKGVGLVVDKAARTLDVYVEGQLRETFPIELGKNPIDKKYIEGDVATPEGVYEVKKVKDVGQTSFHRALLINYPSANDWKNYAQLVASGKVKPLTSPGSLIELHGGGNADPNSRKDWTIGCIALSNQNIDALFEKYKIREGTPLTIVRYGARDHYQPPVK